MRTLFFALMIVSFTATSFAAEKCGRYKLVGRPTIARQGTDPSRQGIALFPDTSNETFVEVEGVKELLGRTPRLSADYVFEVDVTKAFEGSYPTHARLHKNLGPAKSLKALKRGVERLSSSRCE